MRSKLKLSKLPLLIYLSFLQVDGTTENKSLNGARIGVVAKPSAEFVAGVLAIWLSGGVAVPLALSYPEAELLHVMTDSVCAENNFCLHLYFFEKDLFLKSMFL